MAITLDHNWGNNTSSVATSSIATASSSPGNGSAMAGGYVVGGSNLTSIVDSVNGTVPSANIITLGTCNGALGSTVYYFTNPIGGATTARTFTANFGSASQCMINVQSWLGLPASNFIDITAPVNTGNSNTASFTPSTSRTANQVAIALWLPTGSGAITYSGQTITVCGTTGFNGLGNSTSGPGTAVTFNNGYLIGTGAAGSCTGSQGIGVSETWSAFVVTLSPTQIASSIALGTQLYILP